jgi:hypothetical protein
MHGMYKKLSVDARSWRVDQQLLIIRLPAPGHEKKPGNESWTVGNSAIPLVSARKDTD